MIVLKINSSYTTKVPILRDNKDLTLKFADNNTEWYSVKPTMKVFELSGIVFALKAKGIEVEVCVS